MALNIDRNTPRRDGDRFGAPVAAATTLYAGALVCRNASGYAVPGSASTTLTPIGVAEDRVVNAGGNGDETVQVRRGVFRFLNSAAGDAITIAEIGEVCYIVDDETVAKTNGTNTRSRAGFIVDVDEAGVWVLVGYGLLSDPAGALLAANNLSDLANAATSRTNLGGGADKVCLTLQAINLVGATAQVKRLVAPVAGTIEKIYTVLNGALTTGNATLTGKIGAAAITNGVVTITQAGSAAGDVDSATPTAAKTVAVGDVISLTVGGTNDAAVTAEAVIVITPSA